VFDELVECDEREFIDSVQKQWKLNSIQIPCDDAWTFKDWDQWPHNPNQPEGNLYRLILERDYQRARSEGIRVLFNGHVGDALYLAGEEWLADLILERRFSDVWSGLKMVARLKGRRYFISTGHLRATIRALLRRFAPWILAWRRRKIVFPAWLHPVARQYLGREKNPLPAELERHGTLLGSHYAYACSRGNFSANRFGIELRLPYHDRRLVEFMISIPAYMLHYGGLYKHILRVAMQDILPEVVCTRKKATSLNPVIYRGLEREKDMLESNLYSGNQFWEQFVDSKWLLKRLSKFSASKEAGPELFVTWLCISFQRWHQSFTESLKMPLRLL
jgi:asparagine synthase (glutamine-hydrolysing)